MYKAHFQERTVAVKVFLQSVAAISNTTPNQLIRQEVSNSNSVTAQFESWQGSFTCLLA